MQFPGQPSSVRVRGDVFPIGGEVSGMASGPGRGAVRRPERRAVRSGNTSPATPGRSIHSRCTRRSGPERQPPLQGHGTDRGDRTAAGSSARRDRGGATEGPERWTAVVETQVRSEERVAAPLAVASVSVDPVPRSSSSVVRLHCRARMGDVGPCGTRRRGGCLERRSVPSMHAHTTCKLCPDSMKFCPRDRFATRYVRGIR